LFKHYSLTWPNPDELRKDMEEFFSRKYGDKVRLGILTTQPDQARTADEGTETEESQLDLKFDHLPRDIKNYLDRFVIKQDNAKKVLATAICDHYNHITRCSNKERCREYSKQNIIMLGPTGVGKTYLVRTIADLIGVPFVKADATKFSETGYVGGDVEDLVRELVHKADGNIQLAEYGIIYLDEIDKIHALQYHRSRCQWWGRPARVAEADGRNRSEPSHSVRPHFAASSRHGVSDKGKSQPLGN